MKVIIREQLNSAGTVQQQVTSGITDAENTANNLTEELSLAKEQSSGLVMELGELKLKSEQAENLLKTASESLAELGKEKQRTKRRLKRQRNIGYLGLEDAAEELERFSEARTNIPDVTEMDINFREVNMA